MEIFAQPWFIILICVVFGIPILLGILNFILRKKGKKEIHIQKDIHKAVQSTTYQKNRTKKIQEKNAQHVRDAVKKYDKKK